jgi:hypothetical protein
VTPAATQPGSLELLNQNRPVLEAHNCYPEEGRWKDRLQRALAAGFPVAIEQDLAWFADAKGSGQPVLSHEPKTKGSEPSLRDYFFETVRPIVEKELSRPDPSRWPLIVLHLDFKDNQPLLLRAVWDLLGEYESWLTTASKTGDPRRLSPLDIKPILVLTEDSDAQERIFSDELPTGARLRLFGSAHTSEISGKSEQERARLAATMPPERLLTSPATNYRRWWNNAWSKVEEGGQAHAGDWTARDEQRLQLLVSHAHKLGYWIRFYTLNGFAPHENLGWNNNYNFGSREAVVSRWTAAIEAGVNLIATDQYEDLAKLLARRSAQLRFFLPSCRLCPSVFAIPK